MDAEEFWKRVSVRSGVHGRDHVISATGAVFKALRARISHETGEHIGAQFPTDVKELWEVSAPEGEAEFERMNLEQFLDRVGHDLSGLGEIDARQVVIAVFTAIREQLTPGAARKIASELPGDIRELWERSMPGETPIESPASRAYVAESATEKQRPSLPEHSEGREEPVAADRREELQQAEYDSRRIGPSAASVHRSDDQIRAEIERLLEASDELNANEIDVEVHAGRVVLCGEVRGANERQVAVRIAREALGTTEVSDRLRARGK